MIITSNRAFKEMTEPINRAFYRFSRRYWPVFSVKFVGLDNGWSINYDFKISSKSHFSIFF